MASLMMEKDDVDYVGICCDLLLEAVNLQIKLEDLKK